MFPAFLITLREVIEASLIVATILGILVKLNQKNSIKTVWIASGSAALASVLLLILGSLLGLQVSELYEKNEAYIEGVLMVTSALFITWAVFFLHKYFSGFKTQLLKKVKKTIESEEQKGLFILVFTAVFREGFEIVLFLSTIFFSSNPQQIFIGFTGGILGGLLISLALFKATLKAPIYYAFRVSSMLLILFAAGLFARGVHEFAEVGLIPELAKVTFSFIPQKGVFIADMLKSVFGITQKMDLIQLSVYSIYIISMFWYVFIRQSYLVSPKHEE